MTHVGENIRRIRTAKNMTISDVANEHVSRGMISLIENGKTQPSIERLQHIARQLDVDISELVEEVPREKMKSTLKQAIELWQQPGIQPKVDAATLLSPILEKEPSGYEAARMYEIYARILYHLYVLAIDQYNEIEENDWEVFIGEAINLYRDLQMDWRVIECQGFLADIQFDKANYFGTVEIIDQALEELSVMDSLETKSMYIKLLGTKAIALVSLGQYGEAHKQLDDAIHFAREQLVMDQYYNLLNLRSFFYYDSQQPEKAREYVEGCSLFVQLIKHESLSFDFELNQVFREEFYEKDYLKALAIAEQLIGKIEASVKFPKEVKGEFITMPKSLLARVLTRLERYEEALSLFEENPIILPERIQLNPIDAALRVLSNSYEALCHYHLGNPKKAEELARSTVEQLHNMPHSSLYHFGREVLSKVMSK
ncbi:helix-turn-helix domain-containing protein [Sporosarcina thermotolerans]|uniref:Helix-turn-helix domain-containing protein n=1 Tax=Sporosarcina thermotolerans TaxID=633404 RepID=A0AAW9ACP6_9BACL|nr:helix-turn-helix domain-containing protein [Sporosarcina thermotolerans]MDW0118809.1 helix-turn-helix domain-containing protein [Sporosarcina thermotolerans]WHT48500.1 helix-turn-helix domain-containing protein [Sporosarcina thermotolerans]